MEVPWRPRPSSFSLALTIQEKLQEEEKVQEEEEKLQEARRREEEEEEKEEEEEEVKKPKPAETKRKLSSQESLSEEGIQEEEEVEEKVQEEEEKEAQEEEEAAAKERAAQRQQMAVEELVQSERNYLRMLQLSTVTIRSNLQQLQPPPPSLDSMFLHIEEVMDVSSRLLSLLDQKRAQPGDPQFLETLCDAFLGLSSDIEAAYKEYLANYSSVTVLENSYKQKEALWNEIVRVIKASAPEVNATSLSFFLVMPVQRIARYPLLLQTIQKHTAPSHPGHALLAHAAHTAVALNVRINEYKRFREVADKYKKTETLTIKDKINRLNTHSIAKKTARFSQQIKHETGMAAKLVDEEFDALEGFFYVLEHGILELLENVETYLLHLQGFLDCRTEEFDLDMDGEKAPICYKEISTALRQWVLPTFERRMRTLVHRPLCALRDLLLGPRNLIRKRLDKLLDYEVLEAKSSLSYEEQATVNTYRTINTLLLSELPRFNGLALALLWGLLGAFSLLHRDLAADMQQLFQGFAQQLPHSGLQSSAFWEWAEAAVLDGAGRLQTLCRSVEDSLNAPATQPLSPSSRRRLQQLSDRHGPGRLFQVSGSVAGGRELDLSLTRGELVAVLSQADTRGDRRRWLVDAGGRRGYAPSSKLVRYHQAAEAPPPSPLLAPPPSPLLAPPPSPLLAPPPGARRHSYNPGSQPIGFSLQPCFQVLAAYDFSARGSREVSVRAGEAVRVLEPHDKRGNPEWSLVEAGGRRGYVPSNYLTLRAVGGGPSPL